MGKFLLILLCLAVATPTRASDDPLDRLGDALTFSGFDKNLRGKLSGTFDLEAYQLAQPNPGLIFTESHTLINPRLALFFDARWGTHLYGFVQARADRGFDPSADTPRLRWDEYAVRYAPRDDRALVLQVGKFATVLGNWAPRHGSWDNPFISAPLPYETVTVISGEESPAGPADFVTPSADEKYEHLPVIWGPSYATGASIGGTTGQLEYALEVKNAGLTSGPHSWTLDNRNFADPTYTARVAIHPDMRWSFGLSASDGAYFESEVAPSLPPGHRPGSYRQRLIAQDVSFAWHRLQVWAEAFECTFDVPRLGQAFTWSGYVEAKYKFSPQLYGAMRVNRQEFDTMKSAGQSWRWGDNTWRVDFAAGHRFTPHTQIKTELSLIRRDRIKDQVNATVQFTVRF